MNRMRKVRPQLGSIHENKANIAYNKFVADAKIAATQKLGIPRDWWGVWKDVHGPNGARVFFSSGGWTVSLHGNRVSRSDSRSYAIEKARKLA